MTNAQKQVRILSSIRLERAQVVTVFCDRPVRKERTTTMTFNGKQVQVLRSPY